jgi:hypothetical protein
MRELKCMAPEGRNVIATGRQKISELLQTNKPSGDSLANLIRRIFLKKMITANRDLLLIAPGAAEASPAILSDCQFAPWSRVHLTPPIPGMPASTRSTTKIGRRP